MPLATQSKPRVGIPWRTSEEERQRNVEKLDYYFDAVRRAGGEPEHVSLALSETELKRQVGTLDAFVLARQSCRRRSGALRRTTA